MRRRSTRAAGLLILILGLWGGLVPFIGPYFHFTLGPTKSWTWTTSRLWLDVLPGAVAVLGGLMLLGKGPRPTGKLGALLALAAGIWFAIGPSMSLLWNSAGAEGAAHGAKFVRALEILGYHTLLGTLIAALAGYALPGPVTRRAEAEVEVGTAEADGVPAPATAPAGGARRPIPERSAVAAEPATTEIDHPVAAHDYDDEETTEYPAERTDPDDAGEARTAVMDHPEPAPPPESAADEAAGSSSYEANGGSATNGVSIEPTIVRRRRGGLISRLRG